MAINPTVADKRIKPIIFFNMGGIIHLMLSKVMIAYQAI